jgi:glycerol kinase
MLKMDNLADGDLIGALDLGTTSTRFVIFDAGGVPVAVDRREHRQILPGPGCVEHDAAEIWRNVRATITGALEKCGRSARHIASVGIANQRETTVLWDCATGAPLANALVWMDARNQALVDRYAAMGVAEMVRRKTGLPLATYFSALKLAWLFEALPGAREMARDGKALFGTMDSWTIWNLTGGPAGGRHMTDVTNASRTQLMDLETLDWDPELLRLFDIPRACLPEICPSSAIYGVCGDPLPGTAVAGALGDQQAALLGQGCVRPGDAKNTYGTGCFVLVNVGETPCRSAHGLITTLAWQFGDAPPVYALEGSIAIAGAAVQWLRDNIGLIRDSADIEALAQSVPDNGDVYFVPAFAGLFAPYWRADARGLIIGLTRFSNKGHIARATLEAVAYQTHDALAAMAADSGVRIGALKVDGGMAANDLLMQFQADILDAPVIRPRNVEATARGAFLAAALATGRIGAMDELGARDNDSMRFTPDMPGETRLRLLGAWRKAVDRACGWID